MYLELVLRWLHIFSAITLAGGVFFMRFALLPGTSSLAPEQRDAVRSSIRPFWAKCVMATSALLLISGLVNAVRAIKGFELPPVYHALVAVKLLLAFAIFWVTAVLSGRSSTAVKFREKEGFWLNVNMFLIIVIVAIGGVMKVQVRTPKALEKEVTSVIESPVEADSKASLSS